jgi:cyclopropane fatty-acyl-phospholipid synthase-like methyltransferase
VTTGNYDAIEEIGLLYDNVPVYSARRDVDFYVEEAIAHGGKVLEVGCGTGRILIPAARQGAEVTGLDRSARMLAQCKARVAEESPEIQKNVTLVKADMRDFDLGRTFSIIMIHFRQCSI